MKSNLESLCETIFALPVNSGPTKYAKSLLPGGFELARRMERIGERKREVMSGSWVETPSYAALHTQGRGACAGAEQEVYVHE